MEVARNQALSHTPQRRPRMQHLPQSHAIQANTRATHAVAKAVLCVLHTQAGLKAMRTRVCQALH